MEISRSEAVLLIACCERYLADRTRPVSQSRDIIEHLLSRLYEKAGGRMI